MMHWRDVEPWQPESFLDLPTIGAAGYTHGFPQYPQERPARLGVIGDPVSHSLSPAMQVAALSASGTEGEYLAIQVPARELRQALEHLRGLGFLGLNVTLPLKQDELLLEIGDGTVRAVGAANTVKMDAGNMRSTNTDAAGFYEPIRDLAPGRALLLGAGGAARAVAFVLAQSGWEARIWNRTEAGAREIAEQFGGTATNEPNPADCSLVINATSLGLREHEMPPLLWEHLEPESTVYDLVYREGATDFLQAAAKRGARTIDGREMLVAQGAASFAWWLGAEPSLTAMREAVGL